MVTIMGHSRWQLTLVASINEASILMYDTTTFARYRKKKEVVTLKVGTAWQLADFLTKALCFIQHQFLVLIAMGMNSGDE